MPVYPTIIVYVRGGVVQDVLIPDGVEADVAVQDYDVEGEDEATLDRDEGGLHRKQMYFAD